MRIPNFVWNFKGYLWIFTQSLNPHTGHYAFFWLCFCACVISLDCDVISLSGTGPTGLISQTKLMYTHLSEWDIYTLHNWNRTADDGVGHRQTCIYSLYILETLMPSENGHHVADIFKFVSLHIDCWIFIPKYLQYVNNDPGNSMPVLVQIMAWCRQETSHYLNQWWLILPTHICVARPLGDNRNIVSCAFTKWT